MFSNAKNTASIHRLILSVVLMGAVLLQMGTVSATHMRCNTTGKQKVYITEEVGCCPVFQLEPNSFDLRCCDYEQYYTVFNNFKNEHKSFIFSQQPVLSGVAGSLTANTLVSIEKKIQWQHQKAPLPRGKGYLHLICKYNI